MEREKVGELYKNRMIEDINLDECHLWRNDVGNRYNEPGIQIIWEADSYFDENEINAMILIEDTPLYNEYIKDKYCSLFEYAHNELYHQEDLKRFILDNIDCILLEV